MKRILFLLLILAHSPVQSADSMNPENDTIRTATPDGEQVDNPARKTDDKKKPEGADEEDDEEPDCE